jgi:hypothetical protein
MQEISSIFFSGLIESGDVLVAGMRGVASRLSFFVSSGLGNLPGRVNKKHFLSPAGGLDSRHEVVIRYFGRTRECLMMTSERMPIPDGRYTLGQLLCNLYKRGDRWVDELDDRHLTCTVNGRDARLFDMIEPGAEICISSR